MHEPHQYQPDLGGECFSAEALVSMYRHYRQDPASLPEVWQQYFQQAGFDDEPMQALALRSAHAQTAKQASFDLTDLEFPSRSLYLIQAYRMHGHRRARLDPLCLQNPVSIPELELAYYGLSDADLDRSVHSWDMAAPDTLSLRSLLQRLQRSYCGSIAPEMMHLSSSAERQWLQHRLESVQSQPQLDDATRLQVYKQLMKAEEFEQFLHRRYVGQKRFSLEGSESLIPLLERIIQGLGAHGRKEVILGMAHRGRLNVLANLLGKSMSDIFSSFEGSQIEEAEDSAGDVKYHLGFSSDLQTPGGLLHLSLSFNPSHLEIIGPVVLGSVRARQCRRRDRLRQQVTAVLVHGDAAFAGQGVCAESLNLSALGGFRTGGSIRVVVNNQIGFTTNPYDARSSLYCTDVAKMVEAPILHVNGDDPEAVLLAADIAIEYQCRFHKDVVIDLISYRRHGHNEADAPEVTQPVMYEKIKHHQTVRAMYREQLIAQGILTAAQEKAFSSHYRQSLDDLRRQAASKRQSPSLSNSLTGRWQGFVRDHAPEPHTAVAAADLQTLAKTLANMPADFKTHARVARIYADRLRMSQGELAMDWGCAEMLAYASLLHEGGWVRLTGQDSGRGTFFHRHAVLYDAIDGHSHVPLRGLARKELSRFVVVDSMLSEEAVMAFEYGYSVAEPRALVIWEAQYGDFANNAQVVIDQFIASGESKWGRMSGLVLWLPHGLEGQGSEHSSARLERYLQLCANRNMQVVQVTTAAQLFHLLRRQFHMSMRKPLILMGPKSLLRNKASFSSLTELTQGGFQAILADPSCQVDVCKRVILCSGKVYYDLLQARDAAQIEHVALIRIERLYPFPSDELTSLLADYEGSEEVVWVQDEPINQGAWREINSWMRGCLLSQHILYCVARHSLAAPCVASAKRLAAEQEKLMQLALQGERQDLQR